MKRPRLNEHEHSAGCWPGAEKEGECDVMRAFEAMRKALANCTDELEQIAHGASEMSEDDQLCLVIDCRAALKLADEVKP